MLKMVCIIKKSPPKILFCALCSFLFSLSPGCSTPHRAGEALHKLEKFDGRQDGLVSRETWRDRENGGGWFLFADPDITAMAAVHTNQTALGGGSMFTAGSATIMVDTNTAPIVGATGTAIGNVVGAAVKSAVK